jgi:hypothetical protein
MEYSYGSKPQKKYGYMDFVKHLAPVLPKNDKVFFYENQLDWRDNHKKIPLELFKNICHWKSPRPFQNVLKNTAKRLDENWRNALQGLNEPPYEAQSIRNALDHLIILDGVAVPTASALLTAWNPAEFGILDYKVLKVLDMPGSYSITNYLAYHNRLLELQTQHTELKNCALRQIELAIWHYYSIQESDKRQRADG